MPKRKAVTISLAAKCQLLFGLAVLVIIAGALAVPWQRMEQLAGQPNVKTARSQADTYLRYLHVAVAQGRRPAEFLAPDKHWDDASLTDVPAYPQPWMVPLLPGQRELAGAPADDSVARDALRMFVTRKAENEYGRVSTTLQRTRPGGPEERVRIYRYAAAVRADTSCISCHANYRPLMPPDVPRALLATATTTPAASTQPSFVPADGWPLVALIRVDLPYQTDEMQLLLNRIVIVVAGMLGGTLAIVVFYLITSRLILQPVRVLTNTAEKVSKGDLNIRSAISTGDEFQHLSETFNTMLTTLSASQRQLEETNRSLDSRVGELAQSNVDLFEANRIKSEFLTNVSHELRTPLNAIIGFAELLAERVKDPKEQRYLENINTSAKQLLDLINDLLDLAKIEAGKLILREEKVNVGDVCEAMVNFMRPLAGKKNIDIAPDIAVGLPLVTTDPGRFQQILYNFVSNAIKFTPNDGRVIIAARPEDLAEDGAARAVRVSVTDTGPGISPEDQKYIYEKFRQVDGSVTRQHSGSGLGLAISRELANMLGARIDLISELGKGTTFALIIPVQSARGRTVDVHRQAATR